VDQDLEAIRRCRDGDTNSFRALVERYEREAIAHARAILANREDSLDMVQEAFLDAFRALDQFDNDREFYPWFYVILRNRCYSLLKSREKHATVSLDACRGLIVTCSSGTPSEIQDMEEALLEVSAADREIILLKYLDGLAYRELAERLEIPIGTVMSRLFHVRRRLRQKLESEPDEEHHQRSK
jgi:RNA polymerase sigma-70 factor (ECF subfamily)